MAATRNLSPKVDAYLANVKPFALPIMEHLRDLVHRACPGAEESIKWSRPFFTYKGTILCNMSAFQRHCSFGFWGKEIGAVLREAKVLEKDGMGSLGRITSLADLPSDKMMLTWIRQAAAFVDRGEHTSPIAARRTVVKAPKPAVQVPEELTAAFANNQQAATCFAQMSPSCRREYAEWIAGAKRPETRTKRLLAAVAMIAEKKSLNWKYQA